MPDKSSTSRFCQWCRDQIGCGEAFTCPECGSRYHTACWIANSGCANPECVNLAGGAAEPSAQEAVHAAESAGTCPSCGEPAKSDARFCNHGIPYRAETPKEGQRDCSAETASCAGAGPDSSWPHGCVCIPPVGKRRRLERQLARHREGSDKCPAAVCLHAPCCSGRCWSRLGRQYFITPSSVFPIRHRRYGRPRTIRQRHS